MTNADRIRNMTDEQLAEWLDLHGECNQCAYHPAQCEIFEMAQTGGEAR